MRITRRPSSTTSRQLGEGIKVRLLTADAESVSGDAHASKGCDSAESSSESRHAGSTEARSSRSTTSCNQPTRNDRRRRALLVDAEEVTSCLSSWETPTAKPWPAAAPKTQCGYGMWPATVNSGPRSPVTPIGSAQWHSARTAKTLACGSADKSVWVWNIPHLVTRAQRHPGHLAVK